MNIDDLTLKQVRELQALFGSRPSDDSQWRIGDNYFIRTVTHHFTGKLVKVTSQELVLVDAAWIADDGRFAQAVAKGEFSEIEPYPDGREVIVGRGSLIDAVKLETALPRSQT